MWRSTYYIVFGLLGVLALLMLASFLFPMKTAVPASISGASSSSASTLTFSGHTLPVLLAQTPKETERGLSGMPSLPQNEGMLFFFDHSERLGFWMPDMHFAIDMIWLDESWRVVDLLPHATPESYPKVFYPASPARYVLEINDGKAREWGIATGTVMTFNR